MYIPKHYLMHEREEILSFLKTHNFASITSVKDSFPVATHLPFVVKEEENQMILISHFAKANTQWEQISENTNLLIFNGPHAYISPKHYESEMNVPTWNYIAIHVYGKGKIITKQEEAFNTLETMIHNFEEAYINQWNKLPLAYKVKMLNGIVPFKIYVTDIQAKKKLSQNKTTFEQQNIINAFRNSHHENEKEISLYMK